MEISLINFVKNAKLIFELIELNKMKEPMLLFIK